MAENINTLHSEYEQAIAVQRQVISANLLRLRRAHKDCDHAEIKRLNSVLAILYDEKRELEELAQELNSYIS